MPAEIIQGTTHSWDVTDADYPPSAWTLSYVFYTDRQRVSVAGVQSGGGWSVTLTKSTTSTMYADAFAWQAFVENSGGTVRHAIASGVLFVKPDVAANQLPPLDPRSHARVMLEKYNAMFANEAFVKTLLPEQIEALERVRKQFEWDVKRETDAEKLRAGGYPTRKIFTRFA